MWTPMLGPPELSLNPLWAGGLFISQIKFRHFSPRHSEQLVLIFAQIEVTRINIKTMHSKRKPPPFARRGSNRGYPSRRTWRKPDRHMSVNLKVLNFGPDSDKWVRVIRTLRSFGGATEHHWWLSLSLHIALNVVQLCVSIIFSPQTESNFTQHSSRGLFTNLARQWMHFFPISAKSDSEGTARSWQDYLRYQGNR